MQHLLNIHFYAPRLWERVHERPAMLYFVFNADVIAVLVAHDLQRGEMVAQVDPLWHANLQPSSWTNNSCTDMLCCATARSHVGDS